MDYIAALIPVPMKDTMHYWFVGRPSEESFNPRTHEGYDLISTAINMVFQNFNPRAHEGYDVPLLVESNPGQDFNPRTRERYDHDFLQMKSYPLIALIPVPVKGTIRKPYSSVQ